MKRPAKRATEHFLIFPCGTQFCPCTVGTLSDLTKDLRVVGSNSNTDAILEICRNQVDLAEWSKALALGASIFGCVGSNPTVNILHVLLPQIGNRLVVLL